MTRPAVLVSIFVPWGSLRTDSEVVRNGGTAGVCDQDCGDLYLALAGEEGTILFADELNDDAPVLQFTSSGTRLHTLWVTMYACSIEPCSFGYQVFRR
jgi:hypothetical protein